MDENLFSPYIRTAMYSTLPQGYIIKKRIIFDYEIIYVTGGKCRICFDDGEYECKRNDVVFIRPGEAHSFCVASDGGFEQPHIHFDVVYDTMSSDIPVSFKDRDEMSQNEIAQIREDVLKDIPIPHVFVPENSAEFKKFFFSVINQYTSNSCSKLKLKSEMLYLLNTVIQQFSGVRSEVTDNFDRLISLIKEYVDANHMSVITLDGIAEIFSCNKFTVLRKFRRKYGCTIISYYNTKRYEAAVSLLETTELSVKQISEALNFSDEYTFSRFFKNRAGISPTLYRAR